MSGARGLCRTMLYLLVALIWLAASQTAEAVAYPPQLLSTDAPLGAEFHRSGGLGTVVDQVKTTTRWFGVLRMGWDMQEWEGNPAGTAEYIEACALQATARDGWLLLILGIGGANIAADPGGVTDEFCTFASGLAEQLWLDGYRNVIFEITNEPNAGSGYFSNPSNYVPFVNAAASAIRAASQAPICTGGISAPVTPSGNGPYSWAVGVISGVDWSKISFFGYHAYSLGYGGAGDFVWPEMIDETYSIDACIAYMRQLLATYAPGMDCDVLMTERGWGRDQGGSLFDDATKTAYLARMGLLHTRNGVEMNSWYCYDYAGANDYTMPDTALNAAAAINRAFGDNPKHWAGRTGIAEFVGVNPNNPSYQSVGRKLQVDASREEIRAALWKPGPGLGTTDYATVTIPAWYTSAQLISVDDADTMYPLTIQPIDANLSQISGVPVSGMPVLLYLRETAYWAILADGIYSYIYPRHDHVHTMVSGQVETFQVELQNVGNATWGGEASGDPVRIRIRGDNPEAFRDSSWLPYDAADPGVSLAGYVAGPVPTGATSVLAWQMKAPVVSAPTTYHTALALYSVTGECRVNDLAYWDVTVVPASDTHSISVASSNPDSGVTITVTPADADGEADGVTPFARTYGGGASVSLTAPTEAPGGNLFQKWQRDGSDYGTSAAISVTADADCTLTAVYAPPTVPLAANFSATPTAGTAPLTVQFADASTGAVTSWEWTFGDGSASAAQSPAHSYEHAGTYTVGLAVSDGSHSNTRIRPHYLVITFPDVPLQPEEYWALHEILACVDAGVVEGYPGGNYAPAASVARDQMAVYISRALAGGDALVPEGPATAAFVDVPNTGYGESGTEPHWAYHYIEYCVAHGVVQGYDATHYRPDTIVTRDQMAVFVAKAKGWVQADDDMTTAPQVFLDVPAGFWSGTAIQACVEHDVVQGYWDGECHPEREVTRDQMAVYVARAFALPARSEVSARIQGPPEGDLAAEMELRFTAAGGAAMPAEVRTVSLGADGHVVVDLGLPFGLYDVWGKVPTHLARRIVGWSFTADGATLDFGMLLAGDLVNDNVVNQADVDYMDGVWLTDDPVADVNRDGVVNSLDRSLLNANWGVAGDP